MGDKGWKLTILPESEGPGFSGPDAPASQRAAVYADMQACENQAGEHPFHEMTQALVKKYYLEVLERARCLSELGFEMREPPSEAKYVAQLLAQDPNDVPWDPYDDLPSDDVGAAAVGGCPQDGMWGLE